MMAPPKHPVKRAEWRRAVFASELPSSSRLALLALLEYANEDGKAWPSLATLAVDTGLSRNSVRRGLAAAASAGWLQVVERRAGDGRQSSNGYRLVNFSTRTAVAHTTMGHPHTTMGHPRPNMDPSPSHHGTPPVPPWDTNKTREQDQRTSSKQVSQVVRDTWGEVAPGVALPAAVLSGHAEAVQEAALREVATAVAAGRCSNPAGLLVSVLRQTPEDASGATADEILEVLRPPAPPEPPRRVYSVALVEVTPTPEEKAALLTVRHAALDGLPIPPEAAALAEQYQERLRIAREAQAREVAA